MFFTKFSKINYRSQELVNITNSFLLKYSTIQNSTMYLTYTLSAGDTAQSIAYEHYGDARFDFIIFLLNGTIDPFYDWCVSYAEVRALTASRYGNEKIDHIHHLKHTATKKTIEQFLTVKYVQDGIAIQEIPLLWAAVSNLEYEIAQNERYRDIKLLDPAHVQDFMDQIEEAFAE